MRSSSRRGSPRGAANRNNNSNNLGTILGALGLVTAIVAIILASSSGSEAPKMPNMKGYMKVSDHKSAMTALKQGFEGKLNTLSATVAELQKRKPEIKVDTEKVKPILAKLVDEILKEPKSALQVTASDALMARNKATNAERKVEKMDGRISENASRIARLEAKVQ